MTARYFTGTNVSRIGVNGKVGTSTRTGAPGIMADGGVIGAPLGVKPGVTSLGAMGGGGRGVGCDGVGPDTV